MKKKIIESVYNVYNLDELSEAEKHLIKTAIEAANRSYAKYSHFKVGAALLLENGVEIMGCNQENAAYPVTICAERTALFSAGVQYPDQAVVMLAIAARNESGELLDEPVTPCGSCRQAIIETEQRYNKQIRILLYGNNHIYSIDGIRQLMPLSFTDKQM